MMYGDLWIGGLPQGYSIASGTSASEDSFFGCIGDATLNGNVINFANSTDSVSKQPFFCILLIQRQLII